VARPFLSSPSEKEGPSVLQCWVHAGRKESIGKHPSACAHAERKLSDKSKEDRQTNKRGTKTKNSGRKEGRGESNVTNSMQTLQNHVEQLSR